MSSHAQADGRIELRVTVRTRTRARDLVVTAPGESRVEELRARLGEEFVERGGVLWCERRGIALDPSARLGEAGIRWGDRLALRPGVYEPTHAGGAGRVELLVTGGPNAGATWTLGDGQHVIGRSDEATVTIADQSLSRLHARLIVTPAGVTITDLKSSNGVAVDGQRLAPEAERVLGPDEEVEAGRTLLRVRPLGADATAALPERNGLVEFIRRPRVRRQPEAFHRKLDAVPRQASKAQLQIVMLVTPVLAGVVMFVLMHSPVMLAICAISPITVLGNYVSQRHGSKKAFGTDSTRFQSDFAKSLTELDTALAQEVSTRREEAPDLPTLCERVEALDPAIWERRGDDADFLALRVGVADLPARSRIELADGGAEELRADVGAQLESRATVPAVPVSVELLKAGVLGLAGPRSVTSAAAAAQIIQAACLHSPSELVIAAALDEAAAEQWSWLKWLPHVAPNRIGLQRGVAVGRGEAGDLLAEIRDLVADRQAQANTRGNGPAAVLLLLDEDACANRSLVSAVLHQAADARVVAIWLGRDARNLPEQAGTLLEVRDQRAVGTLTQVATGITVDELSIDGTQPDIAERVARALAPIRDVGERSRAGDIPTRISLLELLSLTPMTPAALVSRWDEWRGRLDSTIGVGADGPFTIDLRADGPHALIVGTTGSGKSELLRTFVAAAAASAPPNRLTFLLVDYKGGAAFEPCRGLPHVLDIVSDLDEHLAERALIALEAELKRREGVLAEHGAKDLLELQRRSPQTAPPLLVIAVDEFAKLRDEVPDFVDGVVDIAQRGRSLGVHMVLAAQTLSNAFTPAIKANTNLRVALRVADDAESESVIGSREAARIPSGERYRGRAFARTGHSELHEFQTAYVSGRTAAVVSRGFELASLGFDGPETPRGPGTEPGPDDDASSDLAALGSAAREARAQLGIAKQQAPWLPPLPALLALDSLPRTAVDGGIGVAAIGLVDRPRLQCQDPLIVDLPSAGHLAVYGASGSGRTTALTSLALALASRSTPAEFRVYGVDGGAGALATLEALPHCGGVLRLEDEERIDRLLRELAARVEAPPGEKARRTLLLIDDFDSFQMALDRPGADAPMELVQRILAGGRAAGVHVALSANRRQSVSSALATHIGQRLVLRATTLDDMVMLGLDRKRVAGAGLPPGRGFTQDSEEFQIAVPTRDGAAVSAETEAQLLARAAAELGHGAATRVVRLPVTVALESLGDADTLARLPLGIADADLQTATVDLSDGHFLVAGPYRSGRSGALRTLALGAALAQPAPDLFLLAPRRSQLLELDVWKASANSADACAQAVDGLLRRLSEDNGTPRPAVVFIDDAGELGDPALSTRLERLVKTGRDHCMTIVAAAETAAARGFQAMWLRELRKDGQGLLLQPDLMGDGDLLATRLPRHVSAPLIPGRGFLVTRGTAQLVHVAV